MKLSQITVERLSILAEFVDGLRTDKFDMGIVYHPCGAPACALGHADLIACRLGVLPPRRIVQSDDFGVNHTQYSELFSGFLARTIKTPQQWAAHCRAWLRANGAEPIVSGKESEAQVDTVKASGTEQSASQSARPAASDPFAAFMAEVLKPADCVNS